jgi:hypothetical protein
LSIVLIIRREYCQQTEQIQSNHFNSQKLLKPYVFKKWNWFFHSPFRVRFLSEKNFIDYISHNNKISQHVRNAKMCSRNTIINVPTHPNIQTSLFLLYIFEFFCKDSGAIQQKAPNGLLVYFSI